jgi:hypothetical protein
MFLENRVAWGNPNYPNVAAPLCQVHASNGDGKAHVETIP